MSNLAPRRQGEHLNPCQTKQKGAGLLFLVKKKRSSGGPEISEDGRQIGALDRNVQISQGSDSVGLPNRPQTARNCILTLERAQRNARGRGKEEKEGEREIGGTVGIGLTPEALTQ